MVSVLTSWSESIWKGKNYVLLIFVFSSPRIVSGVFEVVNIFLNVWAQGGCTRLKLARRWRSAIMDKIRCQLGDASVTLLYRGSSLPQFGWVIGIHQKQRTLFPLYICSPQPFWHQGAFSWKTIFPWTRLRGWFQDDSSALHLLCTLFLLLLLAPPQIIRH